MKHTETRTQRFVMSGKEYIKTIEYHETNDLMEAALFNATLTEMGYEKTETNYDTWTELELTKITKTATLELEYKFIITIK